MGEVNYYRCNNCDYRSRITEGPGKDEFYRSDELTREKIKKGAYGKYADRLLCKLIDLEEEEYKIHCSSFKGGWYCRECHSLAERAPLVIHTVAKDGFVLVAKEPVVCKKCGWEMHKLDKANEDLHCPKCETGKLYISDKIFFD